MKNKLCQPMDPQDAISYILQLTENTSLLSYKLLMMPVQQGWAR